MPSEIELLWEKLAGALELVNSLSSQVVKVEARSLAQLDVLTNLLISADPATKTRALASLQVTEEGFDEQAMPEYRQAYAEVREVVQCTIPQQ